MIIVAGHLIIAAAERETYLASVEHVNALARASAGCLDFVQVADPVEHDRVVIFERWEDDAALMAFRSSGTPEEQPAPGLRILSAEVKKYRISDVESP